MTTNIQVCPECGQPFGPDDRYCVSCGAEPPRLRRRIRTPQTVNLILVAIAVVALMTVVVSLFAPNSTAPDGTLETAVPTGSAAERPTTTTAPPGLELLTPSDIKCSLQLPEFPCTALIDGDSATAWSAPGDGVGADITVTFDQAVRLRTILFTNLADDESLLRNARVREIEIHLNESSAAITQELDGGHGPYRVGVPPDPTSSLVIHINSVYPAEHPSGTEPDDRMTLLELGFFGFRTSG